MCYKKVGGVLQEDVLCIEDVAWGPGSDTLQEDERDLSHHEHIPQVQAASLHLEARRNLPVSYQGQCIVC